MKGVAAKGVTHVCTTALHDGRLIGRVITVLRSSEERWARPLCWAVRWLWPLDQTLGEETITTRARPHVIQEDIVIEKLQDFPDNVAAYACHGHLTKADNESVLIPDIEEKLDRHKKLRVYAEVAPDFAGIEPGAWWEDTKFSFSHLFDWNAAR